MTVGSFVARFERDEDGGSGCTAGAHRVSGSMGVSEQDTSGTVDRAVGAFRIPMRAHMDGSGDQWQVATMQVGRRCTFSTRLRLYVLSPSPCMSRCVHTTFSLVCIRVFMHAPLFRSATTLCHLVVLCPQVALWARPDVICRYLSLPHGFEPVTKTMGARW